MFHKGNLIIKKEKTMKIRFKKQLTGTAKILKNNTCIVNTLNLNQINGYKIWLSKLYRTSKD